MSDQPISSLATLTVYSTTDLMEVVDVSDTTFAATGTNKKVTFPSLLTMAVGLPIGVASGGTGLATLTAHGVLLGEGTSVPGFATIGTLGNVLTDQGSSSDPSFTALPTASAVSSNYTIVYALTSGMTNVTGLSIALPSAGTYLIMGSVRGELGASTSSLSNNIGWITIKFRDVTNSVDVPNSVTLVVLSTWTVVGAATDFQCTGSVGPCKYYVTAPATIQVMGSYAMQSNLTKTAANISSDPNGTCVITAFKISNQNV